MFSTSCLVTKKGGGGELWQSIETAVLQPASVGHVTGYPSA